ncbi:replication-associated protein [Bacillariodnavirus LDMD-2013]|uniref:Replication-associated protein n=1 Tax=Bacillariodnavirus LDMD-2013 TaxID=1379694 RepID=S5TNB3_9VIRU|nr:replication-associated protein [Bacillariodnavirus LDMD-2013]AGS36182.1 replication-associated protein [Bacillariodnavirus LDMD-2013]
MSISSSVLDSLIGTEVKTEDDVSEYSDELTVLSKKDRVRACIVTLFPSDSNQRWLRPETYFTNVAVIANWCGQFEKGGHTEKLHCHIWVEFFNQYPHRFTDLCNLFQIAVGTHPNIRKPIHRLSNKSRKCAVNYVLKPTTRLDVDHAQYIWPFNRQTLSFDQLLWDSKRPKPTKKEDDVEKQRLHIESKPRWWSWDQILHENTASKQLLCLCSWGKKYHEGRHAETARRQIAHVVIMYGAGGTGKTTLAHSWDIIEGEDKQERYYRRNPDDGAFWGGGKTAYKGQRIVHLEEFCGQEQFSRFKEICDLGKEGPPVNIKQGGSQLNHDTVIITSNHHPASWYHKIWESEPKQFHPFWRRITQVWFFPSHRPDGSLNIPDQDNPPFYLDQTEDWVKFQGDFNSATNHANKHWPLKELSTFFDPSS